jgi:L-threonylcarbamoyladenylate synthase
LNHHTPAGSDTGLAAQLLREGKLVAIPTETVYGLAGNALDPSVIAQIFSVKQRPHFDPLIVHIPHISHVERYALAMPEAAKRLADQFWPGPLTLVLKKKNIIPDLVTAGGETVALRIPAHPLTLELLEKLDFPLAAPSANPFGYISPTDAAHVLAQLDGNIAYVLDGGPCEIGLESTVVSFAGEHPSILRLGGIPSEEIAAVIPEIRLAISSSSNPASPGQLDRHYSPGTPMEIVGDIARYLQHHTLPERTALLIYHLPIPNWPLDQQFLLSPEGNTVEAASRLYALMREIDAADFDLILATEVPQTGLGPAINDRLKRAAFKSRV